MSYVVNVALVGVLGTWHPLRAGEDTVVVLYCDDCHRWGRPGTTHLCHETWSTSLRGLVEEIVVESGLGKWGSAP